VFVCVCVSHVSVRAFRDTRPSFASLLYLVHVYGLFYEVHMFLTCHMTLVYVLPRGDHVV
jgi:hypothetical protein